MHCAAVSCVEVLSLSRRATVSFTLVVWQWLEAMLLAKPLLAHLGQCASFGTVGQVELVHVSIIMTPFRGDRVNPVVAC